MTLPKFTGVVRDAKVATMFFIFHFGKFKNDNFSLSLRHVQNSQIRDTETLEKALLVYQQDNDTLPLLNKDEELANNAGISLIRMVSATSNDMTTIYESLQKTLETYNDEEEYLYRIDLSKAEDYLNKLKYGNKKSEKDFYVYSTKTGNAFH